VKIDGQMISVHRLIQALLRDNLHEAERSDYRHEVHRILTAGAPVNPGDSTLWPRYRELLAHVTSDTTELAGCQQEQVRTFAMDVVRYLFLSGDLKSCLSLAEEFIAQWAKSPSGPDHPTVLNAQRHRGNALLQLGRYSDAYDIIETTLAKSRKVLGEQEPLTLALRNSFGAALRARGDFAAALELDIETQRLHEEVFGEDDPQTLRVANNLAGDYGLNAGYVEARKLHQQVYLKQRDAVAGVSANDILISMNGLASAIRLSGDFAAARDLGEEARDYGRDKLGAEHYATLRAATGLSIALRRMATAHEDALELAGEVYELCHQLYGERHPDTMAAAVSLSNVMQAVGQTESALRLAKDMAARYAQVYGPDHPYCHGCFGNLALMHRLNGDPVQARRLNQAALDALKGRLTLDHDYSLVVAINLASDHAALGDTESARRIGQDSLTRSRELLGEQHPLTLGCAANLAVDLRAGGAEQEADRLLAETMSHYAATIGTDHPDAVSASAGTRIHFYFDPPPI
jgi:tetratricopeptide (TPR) repeat protein